ncbi:hypothetical protein ONA00_04305 [Mycoplasmopsis cynos]|uniref:hypothetical protein n=1 Tax=Mycoplasmopsis cynos TaxID=171284 RepID=UPI0024CCC0C4|nr:hypothetical protein [Mycoplasmopsis cynos]WAM10569.1 hypothetical protein ONA00_04305 [Mycoplasmopsis cynos]
MLIKSSEASGSIIENLATAKQEALAEVEKLQGHEKYTELKAIIDKENATIEELNSAKTSAIEELNKYKEKIQTAIDSIKEETRKTELKTKLEAAGTYKELKHKGWNFSYTIYSSTNTRWKRTKWWRNGYWGFNNTQKRSDWCCWRNKRSFKIWWIKNKSR